MFRNILRRRQPDIDLSHNLILEEDDIPPTDLLIEQGYPEEVGLPEMDPYEPTIRERLQYLDLVSTHKEREQWRREVANNSIDGNHSPWLYIRTLDLRHGNLLDAQEDILWSAVQLRFNFDCIAKWHQKPEYREPTATALYDPYEYGISPLSAEQPVPRAKHIAAKLVTKPWKDLLFNCDRQPHILVVCDAGPLIVLTPAIEDPTVRAEIIAHNRPFRQQQEDTGMLCGGEDLRKLMLSKHRGERRIRFLAETEQVRLVEETNCVMEERRMMMRDWEARQGARMIIRDFPAAEER